MRIIWKKTVVYLIVAVMVVCMLPQNIVHAENVTDATPDYLVLGDSISTGYGLANPEAEGFTYLIANSLSYNQMNRAVAGYTSADILRQMSDGKLDSEIADAEIITISCGGNDLMAALYQGIADAHNAENGTSYTAEDVKSAVTGTHDTLNLDTFLWTAVDVVDIFADTQALKDALAVYEENMFGKDGVMNYIRERNESAMVIIETQYNPYRAFRGLYISVNTGVNAGVVKLNDSIWNNKKTSDYVIADVYSVFGNSRVNLCNATTSPELNLDFHPNAAGHQKIAETVIETIQANCPSHVNVNDVCTFCGKSLVTDVTGVTLDKEQVSLEKAETLMLTATIRPIDAINRNVTWSSDNTAVATVDDKGVVKAVAAGTAIITVTTEDGGFSAVCKVTVTEKSITDKTPDAPASTEPTAPTNPANPAPVVGTKVTDAGNKATYKVTSVGTTGGTVSYVAPVNKKAASVTIPATVKVGGVIYKVTGIEKNAFKGNKYIKKVTIGRNIKTIGAGAFKNCKKLKTIIIKSTKLKTGKVGKNAFKGIKSTATIQVPKAKLKAYKKMLKKKGVGHTRVTKNIDMVEF